MAVGENSFLGRNNMPCKAKECLEKSVIMFNVPVEGFIPKTTEVVLCEKHAEMLYERTLKLKNGGRVNVVESHCIE